MPLSITRLPHPSTSNGKRLGLALLCSLALHLALLLGVRVRPAALPEAQPAALQVRLVAVKPEQPHVATGKTDAVAKRATPEVSHQPAPPKPLAEHGNSPSAAPVPPRPSKPQAVDVSDARPSMAIPLVDDPVFYPAKQLDVQPTALQLIKPAYPDEAAQHNIQGSVLLLLLIDESGRVREASVVEARPEGYFEEAALSAFRAARFRPAERKGRVVKSRALIRVSFELTGR